MATVIMVFCTVALWVLSISIKTKNKIIMTIEETKKLIKVMQAFADGKDVEVWNTGKWELVPNPSWSTATKYRIKPESKYRPFESAHECIEEMKKHEPFGWINYKGRNICSCVNAVSNTEVRISNIKRDNTWYTFDVIFKNHIFFDGSPFGVMEE